MPDRLQPSRAFPRSRLHVDQPQAVGLHLEPAPRVGLEILAPDAQLDQANRVLLSHPRRAMEIRLGTAEVLAGPRRGFRQLPDRLGGGTGGRLGLITLAAHRLGPRVQTLALPLALLEPPPSATSRSSPELMRSRASPSSTWFRARSASIAPTPASAARST